jgi:hypothetical protein
MISRRECAHYSHGDIDLIRISNQPLRNEQMLPVRFSYNMGRVVWNWKGCHVAAPFHAGWRCAGPGLPGCFQMAHIPQPLGPQERQHHLPRLRGMLQLSWMSDGASHSRHMFHMTGDWYIGVSEVSLKGFGGFPGISSLRCL